MVIYTHHTIHAYTLRQFLDLSMKVQHATLRYMRDYDILSNVKLNGNRKIRKSQTVTWHCTNILW